MAVISGVGGTGPMKVATINSAKLLQGFSCKPTEL
jgi:hypothetical protein